MHITVTTGPMHDCHRCQSSWAVRASSSQEEEVSVGHGGVPVQQGAAGAPRESPQHSGQPGAAPAQGIRQDCGEEAGLRSSREVNPLVRIRPSEGNQSQTEPADQQTGSQG